MIFLLLFVGSILIILNVRALKKEKGSFQLTLDNAGDHMEEFEIQIGALRREFSETILELQMEIRNLNRDFNSCNSKTNSNETIKKTNKKQIDIQNINKEEVNIKENNTANSVKINEIEKLLSQGLSIENIAEKLSMGKGEVLLIKQLYIK